MSYNVDYFMYTYYKTSISHLNNIFYDIKKINKYIFNILINQILL